MKTYIVTLWFDNLDNSLYTDHQAKVDVKIESDDFSHAYLLAERLQKIYGADSFAVEA